MEASASTTENVLSSRIEQVAKKLSETTPHVAADVTQQLERRLQAVAMDTAVSADIITRTVVEGFRREI